MTDDGLLLLRCHRQRDGVDDRTNANRRVS
jgi:hypothetical protein